MSRDDRRDRPGTRRASTEYGTNSRSRQSSTRGRGMGQVSESRGQRLSRRLRGTSRWAIRHRGSLLCLVGALRTVVSLLLLEGTVQLVSAVLTVTIASAGAAAHHHQRNRTMNSSTVRRPSAADLRAHHDAMLGKQTGRHAAPESGSVTVTSHDRDTGRVKSHTRARPGQAQAS